MSKADAIDKAIVLEKQALNVKVPCFVPGSIISHFIKRSSLRKHLFGP